MKHFILVFTEGETEESIMKHLSKKVRKHIRTSLGYDLKLVEMKDDIDYDLFYEKLLEFSREKGFKIQPKSYYRQFRLGFCFYGETIVSYILFTEDEYSYNLVSYFYEDDFEYTNSTYFMYYKMICKCIEDKKLYFNIGGYSAGLFEGIDEFKRRWISHGLGVIVMFPEGFKDRISKRLPVLNKIWQRMKMTLG